ncbi:MAG TPA: hypothetical protein P5099_03870 [Candidatus Moranbacteria bacterium]|nr:hypothetical protein [Candidatus Moranbacteria bacterium]HSA08480.1 hypothetical protein [Candidatus Moranbacteria bacterium]
MDENKISNPQAAVVESTEKVEKNTSEGENAGKQEEELAAEFVELIEKSKLKIDDKVNFILTKGGLKPASVIELPTKLQTQEETKEFFKEDDIKEIINLVKKSGLEYYIGKKEIVEGTYRTKNEPEVEKYSKGEQLNIFISNSKENLDLLTKSWGTTDQEAIGKALGFPPTAVEAFVGKRETWFDEDIPDEIREGEAVIFLTPALSKDNWEEEIKEGKKRAEFVKRNSPEIYNTIIKDISDYRKWNKVENEIEKAADSSGLGIDEGIKNPIIALNAFEINTVQSCEGHLASGNSAPWIRIEAPNEPEERFINQNETFKKVAEKYNMSLEEVKKSHNRDAYWEAIKECSENGETKDYQKWREESEKLLYVTKGILDDFYKNRQVSDNIKIKIDTEGADDMAEGSFVIFNGGEDNRDISDIKLSAEEKESLGNRLNEYRKEMNIFAGFLEEKFFSEGESYLNDKRNKAQEKIDQKKIEKITEKLL